MNDSKTASYALRYIKKDSLKIFSRDSLRDDKAAFISNYTRLGSYNLVCGSSEKKEYIEAAGGY